MMERKLHCHDILARHMHASPANDIIIIIIMEGVLVHRLNSGRTILPQVARSLSSFFLKQEKQIAGSATRVF